MNNTYNMVVRPRPAAQYKLETLSDLAKGLEGAQARRGPRVPRSQGRPAGAEAGVQHGIQGRPADGHRLRYQALSNKQIDVVQRLRTDGMISALKLEAPQGRQEPVAALLPRTRRSQGRARRRTQDRRSPEHVSAMLDEATMAELNYKVDGEKQEPKDVAAAFLKSKGVVK
jgi:osmoprotectant transport system substrate-binding protein